MKIRVLFAMLAAACLVPSLFAQAPQLPDTPAAHQLSGWLAAFNSGDRARLQSFLQKNYPSRADKVDDELAFRDEVGGFDFRKPEDCSATKCAVLVQEHDSDQFARIVLEVEPAAPNAIKSIELRAIARPAEFPLPRLSEGDAIAALRVKLERATADDKFSGTAIVAKDGKPIFSGAYGLADREKKVPNTLDTQFRIGSMNKMFTATAILQLVQAGKVSLDDPLIKFLPDYPNKELATKVKIKHMLSHTGGTGDFFGPEFDKHRLELRTFQDYVKLYGERPLAFEPGTKWSYSNYGFLLLGLVVEKASGQDYYEYVREHIYKPAGMTGTDSLPEDTAVPHRSIGYTKFDSKDWRSNMDTLPYRGTSAGGGYSTVGDLLAFANAIVNHKLLDAAHTDLLTTGKETRPSGDSYAYGFADSISSDGVRCFGHGGGAPGMNGSLKVCTTSGYTIAVLANMDPQAAERMSDFVNNRLPK